MTEGLSTLPKVQKLDLAELGFKQRQSGFTVCGIALSTWFRSLLPGIITLFKDELYKKLAMNANEMAMRLEDSIKEKGYTFTYPPQSNQIFVSMKDDDVLKLQEQLGIGDLGYIDQTNHMKCVRFVTSFHTTKEDISMLEDVLKTL